MENPPGCTKQQTSVFPDYEHLYQEFCTIFLWDHIHERTNIKLDNSSGAQSFLSLETIPSTKNSNLPIFDPATSTKPNIAASQRNSKSSVIFQSPIYLTRKFDKPLQPKTIIPPGFDNSSRAQTMVNFSCAIKGIQFVTKRFSAFPISHGSTKISLQNIKQTLDETTSHSYVLDSPDKNSSPYFLKFQTILRAFWREQTDSRKTFEKLFGALNLFGTSTRDKLNFLPRLVFDPGRTTLKHELHRQKLNNLRASVWGRCNIGHTLNLLFSQRSASTLDRS